MRLIDADALRKKVKTECNPYGKPTINFDDGCKVLDMIDNSPTIEERKTENALRLLLEWAIECGFGYDNIPEEYERYKDDIEGMSYTDGLIYIAKMEVEHETN